jgi:hypothetical protein
MNGYVITDANKKVWVCKDNHSYTLSTDPNKACIFESKTVANSVFKSNLPKMVKDKVSSVKAVKLQVCDDDQPQVTQQPHHSTNNAEIGSSKYIVSVLSDAVDKLNDRRTVLVDELSKYDRQRSDVEHYIELNAGKFNACDGYKAFKLLQDVLLERRKVKDELQIVQVALDRIVAPEELAHIDTKVKELEARQYTPREFKYLFEGDKI